MWNSGASKWYWLISCVEEWLEPGVGYHSKLVYLPSMSSVFPISITVVAMLRLCLWKLSDGAAMKNTWSNLLSPPDLQGELPRSQEVSLGCLFPVLPHPLSPPLLLLLSSLSLPPPLSSGCQRAEGASRPPSQRPRVLLPCRITTQKHKHILIKQREKHGASCLAGEYLF